MVEGGPSEPVTVAYEPVTVAYEPVTVGSDGLDEIIAVLARRSYRTLGPVERDGAIGHAAISTSADLPKGWHDETGPGRYRLRDGGDDELFGWSVGPQSWKPVFFPSTESLWRARRDGEHVALEAAVVDAAPTAIVGARPCELAAIDVLDRVLASGAHPDTGYLARRERAVVVVTECGAPSATCFCASMGTGPHARAGYDLALTELVSTPPRFVIRAGSPTGASVLADALERIDHGPSSAGDLARRDAILERAAGAMGRHLATEGLPGLLSRNIDHPRWNEVAERCLACGNCTMVCPTCFCSDVDDVSDLTGTIERRRHWASCFDLAHSYLHGGPVRVSTASRYRQWLTHKLSTWDDQFATSGCVGCGRCIAWCPVGIDLTEEVAAISAHDGAARDGAVAPS